MENIKITDKVIFGENEDEKYHSIKDSSLIIMVGVTGVGKTTLCNLLNEQKEIFFLPGRRVLTDKIIIPIIRPINTEKNKIMTRIERFDCTKQFRMIYPEGMGHVLSLLKIHKSIEKKILLFDGLRGVNEVSFAAKYLKNTVFIVLNAPDNVRIKRLINRNDSFDKDFFNIEKEIDLAILKNVFSDKEIQELQDDIRKGSISKNELMKKTEIILKEKENYLPNITMETLLKLASERTFVFDTSIKNPGEIMEYLQENFFI